MVDYEEAMDWLESMRELATDSDREVIEWIIESLWINNDLRSS
jgi:hypothetical protein